MCMVFDTATHVAGIAAGNGFLSRGKYMGIAPEANIVSIKVLDSDGSGNSGDVLAGLQWMLDNKDLYNIKVGNLSVGTKDINKMDPLVRAVEAAWDAGIVMIIAAGNNGPNPGSVTSPGISKKVITVGASDDNKRVQIWGDSIENFSGRGPTPDCIIKPDVVAPGADIISCLTECIPVSSMKKKDKTVMGSYLKMSGTSMSTPIISGAVAMLLSENPDLTPDQVKLKIKNSSINLNYPPNQQGWGLIDVSKLVLKEEDYV